MAEVVEAEKLLAEVRRLWDDDVIPTIEDYIRIPNLSPHFAPEWRSEGTWTVPQTCLPVGAQRGRSKVQLLRSSVQRDSRRRSSSRIPSNLRGIDDEGASGVIFYGHYDKQPEFTGWREGLGPWEPVREGSKLYGRGAADDGYAVFAALSAIEAIAGRRWAPCALPRGNRGERGERQPGPRGHTRSVRERIGNAFARHRPRLRLPDLRPALASRIAPGSRLRDPHREGARRRCTQWRRRGAGPVVVPDRTAPAVAGRGRERPARSSWTNCGFRCRGLSSRTQRWSPRWSATIVVRDYPVVDGLELAGSDTVRPHHQADLGACDGGHRGRRVPLPRGCRQRAPAFHLAPTQLPTTADL